MGSAMESWTSMTIGFIGQGYVGKSHADDMERRGYKVVRYALEEPYCRNKKNIKECDVVFVAVPTPTTRRVFDCSAVKNALFLVGKGKTAVIKSTVLPGTTRALQKKFPSLYVMHSPEFLVLKQAVKDAAHPLRNIIGIPKEAAAFRMRARKALALLPHAPFNLVCSSEEAELIKYAGNFFLYLKVLYANLVYELAEATGADYEVVRAALAADPRIGPSHLRIFHDSGHSGAKKGRGAGGACFIKDAQALREFYATQTRDKAGAALIDAAVKKNIGVRVDSKKVLVLIAGIYGEVFAEL